MYIAESRVASRMWCWTATASADMMAILTSPSHMWKESRCSWYACINYINDCICLYSLISMHKPVQICIHDHVYVCVCVYVGSEEHRRVVWLGLHVRLPGAQLRATSAGCRRWDGALVHPLRHRPLHHRRGGGSGGGSSWHTRGTAAGHVTFVGDGAGGHWSQVHSVDAGLFASLRRK